jgi:hypothetical protein
VEAKVQGASQIAQDALHCDKVRLPGIMHMKVNLLDSIGDVGLVNIKYCWALMRLLNQVGSATGGPKVVETLAYVSTGVETGF